MHVCFEILEHFRCFQPFKQKCGKVNGILSFSVASVSCLMHLSMPPSPDVACIS